MTEPKKRPPLTAEVWTLLLVIIGLGWGLALALVFPQVVPATPPAHPCPLPPAPCPPTPPSPTLGAAELMVVVGTIAIILLVGLLFLYGKTYRDTRAPQMLGLCAALVAFLVETILTSPFLIVALGLAPGGLEPFLVVGVFFEDVALAIFLYLSLQ